MVARTGLQQVVFKVLNVSCFFTEQVPVFTIRTIFTFSAKNAFKSKYLLISFYINGLKLYAQTSSKSVDHSLPSPHHNHFVEN